MRTLLTIISGIAFLLASATLSSGQGNSHGPESPLVVGTVSEVLENGDVLVRQKAGGHERHLKFQDSTKFWYQFFEGAGLGKVSDPEVGYVVKARVSHRDGIDLVGNALFTPPLPESRVIENREALSPEELFTLTDQNKNSEIDYVEYCISIVRSEKHGTGPFKARDEDESDALSLDEFREALAEVAWWKYSRKSSQSWVMEADQNDDGVLSPEEFKTFSGKESHFRRTDQDQSGSVTAEELGAYLKIGDIEE